MTVLTEEIRKKYDAQQLATVQCRNYYFKSPDELENGFDSAQTAAEDYPEVLKAIFDSIGMDYAPEVDKAVMFGVSQYQARHGGELPHPSIIAAALSAGLSGAKQASALPAETLSYYDSINESGFDDVNHQHHESVSIVPAITVATIANVIAYATPIVAMIPNSNSSNEVPIVSIRFITNRDFGAMKKSEYLDGANASKPYVEGRFRFALSNGGAGTTYTVTARTGYEDFKAKTPDAKASLLPFIAGNVSIKINGKEVAHTRNRSKSKFSGKISAIAEKDVVVNGVEYRVVGSEIDISASKISVTLNEALPVGAKIEVHLVADFDARDGNDNYLLTPVGVDFEPEYETLIASPIMARVTASTLLQSQLTNELKLGFLGQALAIVQGKIFLEQTVRLLGEAKDLAEYSARLTVDRAVSHYQELYALGTLSAAHFGIEIRPYRANSKIAQANIPIFDPSNKVAWLANNVDVSLLDAQTDAVHVGHFQLNHVTGNASNELNISFIETKEAAIANSAKAIKEIMFNKDGTQSPPIEYLMRLKIYAFDKAARNQNQFEIEHLVSLQAGNLPLDASNKAHAIVTLNFIKMFPNLK
ncbi:hypothetical protein [Acinetobacter pittii]|uniref:hypothetical protein n=2 Tax=Acinetobacter calcoaceticus/baumannii complex TaxID=909768 RepID=UPI00355BF2E3